MDWFQCSDSLIPLAFSFVGAFMSFFSSTTGVVAPAVPADSGTCGSNRIKSGSTLCLHDSWCTEQCDQPFSSGGSLILGYMRKRGDRNHLFNRLLFVAVPISVICCAVYSLIVAVVL